MSYPVRARVTRFPWTGSYASTDSAIVPTVRGTALLKYGRHSYYFYNFEKSVCVCVDVSHRDIIAPGLPLFLRSLGREASWTTLLKLLRMKFHYGFSLVEQIMLMTVPHAVTSLGGGRFIINLWSYVGYLEIDCNTWNVRYLRRSRQDDDHVLGSQQWVHSATGDIFYVTYSLPESQKRISSPDHPVPCKVLKVNPTTGHTAEVWTGPLSDYLHDIMVNQTGQYCVVCELGMFQHVEGGTIPSKVLILDMLHGRQWILDRFIVAAHAQFDPVDPDVIYFSNHNFKFVPASLLRLMKTAIYSLKFTGPAAVFKYRLTADGPREIGVFSEPDLFRLTNFHVFMHRGARMVAAMGFPNYIYLACAETMRFTRRLTIENPRSYKYFFRERPCSIGTFSPSADGEFFYVQTTRSFQVINIASGDPVDNLPLFFNHTAANHMRTTSDSTWS